MARPRGKVETLTTLAESLTARREVLRIFDYGAGVPQTSLCLAEEVRTKHPGAQVELHLADIRTPRREFLAWYCAEIDGVACVFRNLPAKYLLCFRSSSFLILSVMALL